MLMLRKFGILLLLVFRNMLSDTVNHFIEAVTQVDIPAVVIGASSASKSQKSLCRQVIRPVYPKSGTR